MLVTDRWLGLIWDFYLLDRRGETLKDALNKISAYLATHYKIQPTVIETDNKLLQYNEIEA